jgi:hypothetical protein
MGTTLTGTTPQDTYDSLIKVTDNGPLSGSLKVLTDGLGNDSTLSLSTTAASIAGTLSVTGNATFDTTTLVVDAPNDRVGIGTSAPEALLHVNKSTAGGEGGYIYLDNPAASTLSSNVGIKFGTSGGASFSAVYTGLIQNIVTDGSTGASDLVFGTFDGATSAERVRISAAGNVGIGTSAPNVSGYSRALTISSSNSAIELTSATNVVQATIASSAQGLAVEGIGTAGIRFFTSTSGATTERVRITSAGVLDLTQGQIKFPATQVPSADVNTLDDYEEGTWAMGVSFADLSVGVTSSFNSGTYTKIGRQVAVSGILVLTSKGSSTGFARITGLPFTSASGSQFLSAVSLRISNISFADFIQANVNVPATNIDITQVTNAGVLSSITDANFADDSVIIFTATYFTA